MTFHFLLQTLSEKHDPVLEAIADSINEDSSAKNTLNQLIYIEKYLSRQDPEDPDYVILAKCAKSIVYRLHRMMLAEAKRPTISAETVLEALAHFIETIFAEDEREKFTPHLIRLREKYLQAA